MKDNMLEELRRLYKLADKVREIAPWEFMYEDQVFCVKDPDTHVLCFISIMGSLGEQFALSAYTGVDEYRKFVEFKEGDPMNNPEKYLEINQLQVSFNSKPDLEKEDVAILKALGLSYSQKNQWPIFRSLKDGFLPWFLEPDEVKTMAVVLEQSIEIMMRRKSGLTFPDPDDDNFLVRYAEKRDGGCIWNEKTIEIEFPGVFFKIPAPDEKLIRRIMLLPATNKLFEFDFALLLNPIRDIKTERPYYAAMALLVDHRSGMIVGSELFGVKCNYIQRLEQAPAVLLKLLSRQKIRPKGVDIVQPELHEILEPLLTHLEIKLRLTDELEMIAEVREDLRENL
jgi:hypothetical protein